MLGKIGFERRKTRYGRAAFAERAQPGIDSKGESICCFRVKQSNNVARPAREIFLCADAALAIRFITLRIQKDNIDIRGKIEFAAPKLSHAKYDDRHGLSVPVSDDAESSVQHPACESRGSVQ